MGLSRKKVAQCTRSLDENWADIKAKRSALLALHKRNPIIPSANDMIFYRWSLCVILLQLEWNKIECSVIEEGEGVA